MPYEPRLPTMAASIAFVLLAVCATAAFRWCLGRVFDRAGARRAFSVAERARVIAFFHPYCNSAGGGERVLWLAIAALGQLHAKGLDLHVVVYTGDGEDDATILRTAADRFGVSFGTERRLPIDFVRLSRRRLLEAARYPRLTMIMQSLGSMVVAVEALCRATPDIFVDSTGFAFTLVIARLLARCARALRCTLARPALTHKARRTAAPRSRTCTTRRFRQICSRSCTTNGPSTTTTCASRRRSCARRSNCS